MQIFAYSGPQENSFDGPKAVQNSASIFFDRNTARPCIRADFISNKAGITVIKLTISKNGVILAQHDFMVGWMAIASARMTNAGSVTENAGAQPGNSVNVQVTGSIPLNSEFQADFGLPATLTMPNDWARWAGAMATTDQNLGGVNALPASSYWDIHDSSGPGGDGGNPDIHVAGFCSPTTPSTTIDQVDNCNGPGMGSRGKLPFSRVFGDSGTGVGPFDPSYSDTLLSDGNLNSFDAPMPALKIVFNSSGGMGGFVDFDPEGGAGLNASRACTTGSRRLPARSSSVSRTERTTCTRRTTPPTSRRPRVIRGVPRPGRTGRSTPITPASPTTSRATGGTASITYWAIAQTLVQNESQDTNCLLTTQGYKPVYRQTNGFPTSIVEFTDEHGEARAQWQPGLDNDNFGTTVGFVDDNGGCDLEGVSLGAQTITAAARYPFQHVANDVAVTGTITKNINNLFRKTLSCVRKNNVSSAVAYICTATARDIAGNGDVFNGEKVCFSREPDNVWYNVGGSSAHPNGYCVELSGGTATAAASVSAETPGTLIGTLIDVQGYFAGEKLLRDTCIVSGAASSTAGPCQPAGGGGGGGSGGGGIKTPPTTQPKAGAKATVVSVQIVMTAKGRVLMVKVHSTKSTAKIQVRLINAKGHVIKNALRAIKTNKRVKVKNLRITKQVKTVRVRVAS